MEGFLNNLTFSKYRDILMCAVVVQKPGSVFSCQAKIKSNMKILVIIDILGNMFIDFLAKNSILLSCLYAKYETTASCQLA